MNISQNVRQLAFQDQLNSNLLWDFWQVLSVQGFQFKIKWLYLIFSSRSSRLSFWDLDIFLGKKGEISKVLLDRVGIDTIWVSDLKSDKIKWRLKNIVLKDFFFLHIHLSLQSHSHVRLFGTPWTATHQASLAITNSQNLFKLMFIKSVMPSNHHILCLKPSPPAFSLSQHQGLFKWVTSSPQMAKVLELHLQHQSFQRIFRTDFL